MDFKFERTLHLEDVKFNITGLFSRDEITPEPHAHDDGAEIKYPQIKDMEVYIGCQKVNNVITEEVKSKICAKVIETIDKVL